MATHGGYKLYREGDNVAALLDKIEDLDDATQYESGTMSARDKTKLDNIEALTNEEIDILCS